MRRLARLLALALVLAGALVLSPGEDSRQAGEYWVEVNGTRLDAALAATPAERMCGYTCFNTSAIVFVWPDGAPSTVAFTMESLNFSLLLLHVRDCRVIRVVEMKPGGIYPVTGVQPDDVFIEVRDPVKVRVGDPVRAPFCQGRG